MAVESIVLGAFIGDALSLGPHWVYDPKEIARAIPLPDQYHDPVSSYHPGKKAGDFTHYGDQALLLLRHIAGAGGYELDAYAKAWKAFWENPATFSYRDGATRGTLANLEKGLPPEEAGAVSHDIAGVSIIAPLFLLEWPAGESLISAVERLVAFTHRDPDVIAAASFFTRVILSLRGEADIRGAIASAGASLPAENLERWLAAGLDSAASSLGDDAALEAHGLSCNIDGGFAGVMHLLIRYPQDPFTALVNNATAGGDNAARGMILGMVYGAADLLDDLPGSWRDGLSAKEEIYTLCKQLRDR